MSLEALNKRIKTTTDLRDIVSTMKMLSSVSVGQYERALLSLNAYARTVREGFQGLLQNDEFFYTPQPIKNPRPKTVAVVIGSDNGLVGRFNRDVMMAAKEALAEREVLDSARFLCVGKRVGLLAESQKLSIAATYAVSNSLKEIASVAAMILLRLNDILVKEQIEQVFVFYSYRQSGAPLRIEMRQLMPLPYKNLTELRHRKWEGRSLPLITAERRQLFSALIHEYLTVVLTRALTASLAAEHYTRMVNMQQAEQNIDASLEEMNLTYQQMRQTSITDELIDIVSGAESMKKEKKK